MSNFLAIATVTATLQQLLQAAVATDVAGTIVTTQRPEPNENLTDARVNLYLFQVTPNAAWRNVDLPTRSSSGQLVARPQVALDLHYLLSFYGNEGRLEPQRLLGSVARTLHARPVLTRQIIRSTIASPSFNFLANSNLAEEVELVKLIPEALSLEELSKVWSVFFQTPYALSLAYQASVVLVESEEPHREALPVRQRMLYVGPFRQPVIESVTSSEGAGQAISVGSTLIVHGQSLAGDVTQVRIGESGPMTPVIVSDNDLQLLLAEPPLPAGALRAGVQGVQVVQPLLLGVPPTPHRGVESNVAAFVLQPTIVPPVTAATLVTASGTQLVVTVKLRPEVGKDQRIVLLLNERGGTRAYRIPGPPRAAATDTIAIPISDVKAADYLVRVQIDGAQSSLAVDASGQFSSPVVTIP